MNSWNTGGGFAILAVFVTILVSGSAVASGTMTPRADRHSCNGGSMPTSEAFDPTNHLMYVSDSGDGNVTLLEGTCTVYATFQVGPSYFLSDVYDPSDHLVFVSDFSNNEVFFIDGTSVTGVVKSSQLDGVSFLAYDPLLNDIWATNNGGNTVTLLNSSGVQKSEPVGECPLGIAFSSRSETMTVANLCSNTVTILNASSGNPIRTFGVGSSPYDVAYNPDSHLIYVSNCGSNNISVVSSTGVVRSVPVGKYPQELAFDPRTHQMFVANGHSNSVSIVNSSYSIQTDRFPAGTFPYGVGYDPATGVIFVTGLLSDEVYVIR